MSVIIASLHLRMACLVCVRTSSVCHVLYKFTITCILLYKNSNVQLCLAMLAGIVLSQHNKLSLTHTLLNSLACDPGTYARVSTGMCEMCPNNSNSTVQGSAECLCDDGFYRLPTEIDLPCTRELKLCITSQF